MAHPLALALVVLSACGKSSPVATFTWTSDGSSTATSPSDGETSGESVTSTSQTGGGAEEEEALTAGAWDDNLNYDWFTDYLEANEGLNGQPSLSSDERDLANALFVGPRDARQDLDVAILFDTTGSMGDELAYLKAELGAIAVDIEASAPTADIRWGLVVYRDRTDAYLTKSFPFTSDLATFQADLADQFADGGGDYPEATQAGLADALDLGWRTEPQVARLLFWVADAPHHPIDEGEVTSQIRIAADQDVHVYPVAASGTDPLAELTFRSAAQLTGGRYLFLTDDSGIGEAHQEPSIPCYYVTTLHDAMVRMVDIELSGVYREPAPQDILRRGGDPQDGACTLSTGTEVYPF